MFVVLAWPFISCRSQTRMPIKFGPETLSSVTCARVRMRVQSRDGRTAEGWGETPLSVQWGWPSTLPYEPRHAAMKHFCLALAKAWAHNSDFGHPVEIGSDFEDMHLSKLLAEATNLPRLASRCPGWPL